MAESRGCVDRRQFVDCAALRAKLRGWDQQCRDCTGMNGYCMVTVVGHDELPRVLAEFFQAVVWCKDNGRATVKVFCHERHGKHRSVGFAELAGRALQSKGVDARVVHLAPAITGALCRCRAFETRDSPCDAVMALLVREWGWSLADAQPQALWVDTEQARLGERSYWAFLPQLERELAARPGILPA